MMSLSSRIALLALAAFGVVTLRAQDAGRITGASDSASRQTQPESPKKSESKSGAAPSLYEGESEEVGPQLLLLETPPHDWFQALADAQGYYTSNATLVESDETWSDVTVLTAQAGVNARPYSLAGGTLALSGGYRYQKFNYGLLTFRGNHDLSGGAGKLDSLDFETHTGYLSADWSRGGWSAGVGGRYTAYLSSHTDKSTYSEWSPSLNGGYRLTLSERDFLSFSGDAAYRFTHTFADPVLIGSPFGLDFNDRYDLGLNVAYSHIFGQNLLVQPAYRFQYSGYTEGSSSVATGPGREDFYHIFSLTVAYYFDEHFSARVFGSAEFRESTRDTVADYSNYNTGVGVMASVTF